MATPLPTVDQELETYHLCCRTETRGVARGEVNALSRKFRVLRDRPIFALQEIFKDQH